MHLQLIRTFYSSAEVGAMIADSCRRSYNHHHRLGSYSYANHAPHRKLMHWKASAEELGLEPAKEWVLD
jgi:hypothetical protein